MTIATATTHNLSQTGPAPVETELLDAARSGDTRAVEELYRLHSGRALAMARRHATPDYPAQDLAADATIAMLDALARGEGPRTSVPAYLAVSIRNLAARAARRRAHHAYAFPAPVESMSHVADGPDRPGQPEQAALKAETRRELASVLDSLTPNARQILHLLHFEHLTPQECALRLGISPDAVRSLSYRARKAARQRLVA